MKRVYVAGAISCDHSVGYLDNIRRGMKLSYEVLKAGFAPFVPFFDYHFSLMGPMSEEEYYGYSMAWLEACDAVIVVNEGWEESVGTVREIARARELGMPVFFSLEGLNSWVFRDG